MKSNSLPASKSLGAVSTITLAMVSLSFIGITTNQSIADDDEGAPVIGLWEPFAPAENPVTDAKRVLGKLLFWDEQLSTDNTISCGTCHITSEGGVDPRDGVNPGFDGIFGNDDDILGSKGVIKTDSNGEYLRSVLFDLMPQVTPRRSMSNFVSMYAGNLFWDGRAEGTFFDPLSGDPVAFSSAALEIQSLMPILNEVEMAHQNRDWPSVISKLENAKPMALASDIPQDMLDAITTSDGYPELFEMAFGDPEITPVRIGFAIATYERTLVPNQSPWDNWVDGDPNGMTSDQLQGWQTFRASACNNCHVAPLFTTNAFTVNGIRPNHEDLGRSVFSGTSFEDGAFRMSALRNLAIRDRFDHTGQFTMDEVFDFYAHRNGQQPFQGPNLDFRLFAPIVLSPVDEALIKEFITNGLTDPRVANETFPFDRPTLHSELPTENPLVNSGGSMGSGGFIPQMIAVTPPNIGNTGFKIGIDFALGGAQAWVAISSSPPVEGVVAQDELIGPIALNGMGNGDGFGTLIYPIDDLSLDGETFYMQWLVSDPNAKGGFAHSQVAQVTPFCSMIASCVPDCPADMNGDGELNFFDVSDFLAAYGTMDAAADINGDGEFNFFDVSDFLVAFGAGCP
ncbi:MAG: cytochrome c peroxidase [Phycisphaerales bacterium]|nr:cytochrome c peroxidase [Phycisphaerales bacterium]